MICSMIVGFESLRRLRNRYSEAASALNATTAKPLNVGILNHTNPYARITDIRLTPTSQTTELFIASYAFSFVVRKATGFLSMF